MRHFLLLSAFALLSNADPEEAARDYGGGYPQGNKFHTYTIGSTGDVRLTYLQQKFNKIVVSGLECPSGGCKRISVEGNYGMAIGSNSAVFFDPTKRRSFHKQDTLGSEIQSVAVSHALSVGCYGKAEEYYPTCFSLADLQNPRPIEAENERKVYSFKSLAFAGKTLVAVADNRVESYTITDKLSLKSSHKYTSGELHSLSVWQDMVYVVGDKDIRVFRVSSDGELIGQSRTIDVVASSVGVAGTRLFVLEKATNCVVEYSGDEGQDFKKVDNQKLANLCNSNVIQKRVTSVKGRVVLFRSFKEDKDGKDQNWGLEFLVKAPASTAAALQVDNAVKQHKGKIIEGSGDTFREIDSDSDVNKMSSCPDFDCRHIATGRYWIAVASLKTVQHISSFDFKAKGDSITFDQVITSVAVSPTEQYIYVSFEKQIIVYEVQNNKDLAEIAKHDFACCIQKMMIVRDNEILVLTSPGELALYSLFEGKLARQGGVSEAFTDFTYEQGVAYLSLRPGLVFVDIRTWQMKYISRDSTQDSLAISGNVLHVKGQSKIDKYYVPRMGLPELFETSGQNHSTVNLLSIRGVVVSLQNSMLWEDNAYGFEIIQEKGSALSLTMFPGKDFAVALSTSGTVDYYYLSPIQYYRVHACDDWECVGITFGDTIGILATRTSIQKLTWSSSANRLFYDDTFNKFEGKNIREMSLDSKSKTVFVLADSTVFVIDYAEDRFDGVSVLEDSAIGIDSTLCVINDGDKTRLIVAFSQFISSYVLHENKTLGKTSQMTLPDSNGMVACSADATTVFAAEKSFVVSIKAVGGELEEEWKADADATVHGITATSGVWVVAGGSVRKVYPETKRVSSASPLRHQPHSSVVGTESWLLAGTANGLDTAPLPAAARSVALCDSNSVVIIVDAFADSFSTQWVDGALKTSSSTLKPGDFAVPNAEGATCWKKSAASSWVDAVVWTADKMVTRSSEVPCKVRHAVMCPDRLIAATPSGVYVSDPTLFTCTGDTAAPPAMRVAANNECSWAAAAGSEVFFSNNDNMKTLKVDAEHVALGRTWLYVSSKDNVIVLDTRNEFTQHKVLRLATSSVAPLIAHSSGLLFVSSGRKIDVYQHGGRQFRVSIPLLASPQGLTCHNSGECYALFPNVDGLMRIYSTSGKIPSILPFDDVETQLTDKLPHRDDTHVEVYEETQRLLAASAHRAFGVFSVAANKVLTRTSLVESSVIFDLAILGRKLAAVTDTSISLYKIDAAGKVEKLLERKWNEFSDLLYTPFFKVQFVGEGSLLVSGSHSAVLLDTSLKQKWNVTSLPQLVDASTDGKHLVLLKACSTLRVCTSCALLYDVSSGFPQPLKNNNFQEACAFKRPTALSLSGDTVTLYHDVQDSTTGGATPTTVSIEDSTPVTEDPITAQPAPVPTTPDEPVTPQSTTPSNPTTPAPGTVPTPDTESVSPQTDKESDDGGLSSGAIAGIVIGVIIAVIILGIVVAYLVVQTKKKTFNSANTAMWDDSHAVECSPR